VRWEIWKFARLTLDLGDTVRVTEDLTNPAFPSVCVLSYGCADSLLGGSGALLCELGDLLDDLLGGGLQPRRGVAGVGDGGG
jgi:hypothetical protein